MERKTKIIIAIVSVLVVTTVIAIIVWRNKKKCSCTDKAPVKKVATATTAVVEPTK